MVAGMRDINYYTSRGHFGFQFWSLWLENSPLRYDSGDYCSAITTFGCVEASPTIARSGKSPVPRPEGTVRLNW